MEVANKLSLSSKRFDAIPKAVKKLSRLGATDLETIALERVIKEIYDMSDGGLSSEYVSKLATKIVKLKKYFPASVFPKKAPKPLYRGLLQGKTKVAPFLAGKLTYRPKRVESWSTSPNIAASFAALGTWGRKEGRLGLVIKVPKGTPIKECIDLGALIKFLGLTECVQYLLTTELWVHGSVIKLKAEAIWGVSPSLGLVQLAQKSELGQEVSYFLRSNDKFRFTKAEKPPVLVDLKTAAKSFKGAKK